MEQKAQKRMLLAAAIYLGIFALILLISCLTAFNELMGSIFSLLRPVLIGLVLSYLLNPFFRFYERKLFYKINPLALRRGIALFFTYLTLVLIFALLLLLIVPQLINSILQFINDFNTHLDQTLHSINGTIDSLNQYLPLNAEGNGMIPHLKVEDIQKGFSSLLNTLNLNVDTLSKLINLEAIGSIIAIAGNVVSVFTDTIFGIFISLYLLASKEKRYAQIKRTRCALFSDKTNMMITKICSTADRSFGGYLRGVLLDSVFVGIIVYVIISIIGIPYAALISVMIGITNIIPILGPFIGAIPSAIIILLSVPEKTIPFLICLLVVQQIDGNILAPRVLGENTGVSSLSVIIAISTMGTLWGLAGMILGVPLFATVLELTSEWLDQSLRAKGLPTDTDLYVSTEVTEATAANTALERRKRRKNRRKNVTVTEGSGDLTEKERKLLDTFHQLTEQFEND